MKRLLLLFFLPAWLLVGLRPAAAQNCVWNQGIAGANAAFNQHRLMATDAAGNSYATGTFSGQLVLGADTLREADTTATPRRADIFLAKFNAAGQAVWAKRFGGLGADSVSGLARDGAGNLFLAGSSAQGLVFGASTLAQKACWLAKCDANGNGQWLKPLFVSNSYESLISVITADNAGNCYLAANSPRLDSVSTYRVQAAANVSVVAQFDGNGTLLGAQEYIASKLRIYDMVVSPTGDLFCTGPYWNTASFGAPTILTLLGSDTASVFLTRCTTTPNFQTQWVRGGRPQGGTGSIILGTTLVADASNNCYLGGWTSNGLRLNSPGGIAVSRSNQGSYLVKFDAFGTPQWITGSDGSSSFFDYPLNSVFDANGNVCTAGYYYGSGLQFGSYGLVSGPTAGARPYLVCHNPSGVVQWARNGEIDQPNQFLYSNGLGTDVQGNLYLYGSLWRSFGGPAICSLTFDGQAALGPGVFLSRFDRGARVTGAAFLDQNANGVRDAGEDPFPVPLIVTETTRSLFCSTTTDSAVYNALLPTGAYALSVTNPPTYYTVSTPATGSHTGQLTAIGQIDAGRDFGLAPTPGQVDLRVTLTAFTPARVGQPLRYRARVDNVGTTTIPSAQVSIQLDTAALIIGGVPTPTSQTGQTLTWSTGQLAPFGTYEYEVVFSLPINVPSGTPLVSVATVTPLAADRTPANNLDTVRQSVVSSFDPNDISVNYTQLTTQQVASGTMLDYLIRFQNLGTDTAFAVTIQDSLPASLLQLGTVQLVAQSHNCQWSLSGQGELRITFPGIRLPQQRVDAMRSLGYVRFRVVPRSTLTPGALIPNQAHIKFDFNAPLATNEVTTLVQTTNGLVAEPGATRLSLYPNPADRTARVTLTADVLTAGTAQVLITDVLGRTVRQETAQTTTGEWRYAVPTADLKPGVYVVRLTLPGGGRASRKLVVQ